jgi:hypothetical protein
VDGVRWKDDWGESKAWEKKLAMLASIAKLL